MFPETYKSSIDPLLGYYSVRASGANLMALSNPEEVSLSSLQRVRLKLFGCSQVGYIRKQGWTAEAPLYAFRCEIHGVVRNTPQGHGHLLICPLCLRDEISHRAEDLAPDVVDQIPSVIPEN